MHLLIALLIAINKSSRYGLDIATVHHTYSVIPPTNSKITLLARRGLTKSFSGFPFSVLLERLKGGIRLRLKHTPLLSLHPP